ncbi:hypothetical protein NLU13_8670 [Sarocladium strictum]|uniref:F-box domain-containing protein n=1 Tax=Sarocladium strictum TaxID=5046 RepID=A0AA39GCU1_SARSR|nr:hypothetical protein NLU13_8670 [Sarocladium strictum]
MDSSEEEEDLYVFPDMGPYVQPLSSCLEDLAQEVEDGHPSSLSSSLPSPACLSRKRRVPLLKGVGTTASASDYSYPLGNKLLSQCGKAYKFLMRGQPVLRQRDSGIARPRSCPRAENTPALYRLPGKLRLAILCSLDAGSLYLLRQTSAFFMRLLEDEAFRRTYHQNEIGEAFAPYALGSMSNREQQETARLLQRDMFCRGCRDAQARPDWDARLAFLEEKLFCKGCSEEHPRFLFPSQSATDRDHEQAEGLLCIGRLGEMSLCRHRSAQTRLSWDMMVNREGSRWTACSTVLVCSHPSHRPAIEKPPPRGLSASPHLHIIRPTSDVFGYEYGCDTPILDMEQRNMPTLSGIREALLEIVSHDPAHARVVCTHLERRGRLRDFVRSGVCACFTEPGRLLRPFSNDTAHDCSCERERYLACEDCGAEYAWCLAAGRVSLCQRYVWLIQRPISPSWILRLDEGSYGHLLFTESTRHVLWCESRGCVTRHRRRWISMIKLNMLRENDRDLCTDYGAALVRSEHTAFQMPKHLF